MNAVASRLFTRSLSIPSHLCHGSARQLQTSPVTWRSRLTVREKKAKERRQTHETVNYAESTPYSARYPAKELVSTFGVTPVRPSESTVSEQEVEALKSMELRFPENSDTLFRSIDVETKGHDPAVLESYRTFAFAAAAHLNVTVGDTWAPKTLHWRKTTLKSVHIFKKAMVQYETKTFFQCWRLEKLTGSTADTYLEYIQRNLPEGVAMKVTKRELLPLPSYFQGSGKRIADA